MLRNEALPRGVIHKVRLQQKWLGQLNVACEIPLEVTLIPILKVGTYFEIPDHVSKSLQCNTMLLSFTVVLLHYCTFTIFFIISCA